MGKKFSGVEARFWYVEFTVEANASSKLVVNVAVAIQAATSTSYRTFVIFFYTPLFIL